MADYRKWTLEGFGGTLCVDELHLGRFTLLLATDPLRDRPVAFALVGRNDADHMRRFLKNLKAHGFAPQVVVTDGSNLYPALLAELWPDARHQLCVFHLMKNALSFLPKPSLRPQVVASLRAVFDAPDRLEAERQLEIAVKKYQATAPGLADWLEANVPQGLTIFALPVSHQRRLRTSNMLERLHEEIKRRTRVAGLFSNDASALRLVSAVLMEVSEEWETNRKYLTMGPG